MYLIKWRWTSQKTFGGGGDYEKPKETEESFQTQRTEAALPSSWPRRPPRLQQPESKIWVRTEALLSIHRKRTIFHYVSLFIGNYQQVLSEELAQSSKVQQKPLRVHQAQGSSPESLGHSGPQISTYINSINDCNYFTMTFSGAMCSQHLNIYTSRFKFLKRDWLETTEIRLKLEQEDSSVESKPRNSYQHFSQRRQWRRK